MSSIMVLEGFRQDLSGNTLLFGIGNHLVLGNPVLTRVVALCDPNAL